PRGAVGGRRAGRRGPPGPRRLWEGQSAYCSVPPVSPNRSILRWEPDRIRPYPAAVSSAPVATIPESAAPVLARLPPLPPPPTAPPLPVPGPLRSSGGGVWVAGRLPVWKANSLTVPLSAPVMVSRWSPSTRSSGTVNSSSSTPLASATTASNSRTRGCCGAGGGVGSGLGEALGEAEGAGDCAGSGAGSP